jgi:hypothetical protein
MYSSLRAVALCLALLSTSVITIESSEALSRRRGSASSVRGRPERPSKPVEQPATNPTVITLPSGTTQVIPSARQCVLQIAHKYHPGRLIGGRIDQAGRGGARIRGPIIRQVEEGIREAQAALSAAMAQALAQIRGDMISQINTAFQLGGISIGCDKVLEKFQSESLRKCEANRGRFLSEGAAQCAAGRKTPEQRDVCNCLVGPISDALVQNCSLLSQSPEILNVVNTAYASCKKSEATIGQMGQAISGALSQLTNRPLVANQE